MSKKHSLLGMNPSTASHRLVKDLLWKMITESKQDICFHCGKMMTRETFSIEHKKPWMSSENPLQTYFDLENISFSHLSCNVTAGRKGKMPGGEKLSMAPQGTSWCSGCKDYLNIDRFHKNRNHKNGLQWFCQDCRKDQRGSDVVGET